MKLKATQYFSLELDFGNIWAIRPQTEVSLLETKVQERFTIDLQSIGVEKG